MKTRSKCREEEEGKKEKKRRNENVIEDDDSSISSSSNNKKNDDDESPSSCLYPYVCVYCGTPCAALYRQLTNNSLSSIKAMNCERCQRIVDPYTEREWLLVVIDCILLRPEAYRHILYNNQDLSWYANVVNGNKNTKHHYQERNSNGRSNAAPAPTAATAMIRRLVQWTIVSSLFHAYLKWETLVVQEQQHLQQQHQHQDGGNVVFTTRFANDSSSTLLYAIFVVTSILDLVAQWLAIYGYMNLNANTETANNNEDDGKKKKLVSKNSNDNTTSSSSPPHSIAYQIYLGLLLPTSFQVVCVVVLIWDNSKTTRALGSLLIACWQCLAISLISINNNNNNGNTNKTSAKSILTTFTPLVGVLSLMGWRFGVTRLLVAMTEFAPARSSNSNYYLHHIMPCVGFEVDSIFGDTVNVITYEDGISTVTTPFPLQLCLT